MDIEKEEIEEKDNKGDEQEVILEEQEQDSDAEKKCAEYLDKYQRAMAEFDNFRKRTSKEKASMYDDGVRDTIEKLLPVVDNLERAVLTAEDKENPFVKGVIMVLKQFKEIFSSMDVFEIPAMGEKFDPNLHSAVSHIEDENFGENEICVEMMKGYKYKDKVIRHSMVQVAN